jgi:chromosome segregation ATPase
MNPDDLTLEVLKSLRDEMRETRTELSADVRDIRAEVRDLRTEMGVDVREIRTEIAEVARRVVESEVRTATAITELHGTVHDLVDVLRAQHDVRPRLERAEREITEIKNRLGM